MSTIDISPLVAAREANALAEHWRNRALINAQIAQEASEELASAKLRIAELEEHDEDLRPVDPNGVDAGEAN